MSVRSALRRADVDRTDGGPPLSGAEEQAGEQIERAAGGRVLVGPTGGEFEPVDNAVMRSRRRATWRRRYVVYGLRLIFGVVWIGSWELTTRLGWVDSFFFGMPSRVIGRLWEWITQGTSLGPLWLQVAVTMQETVLGFAVGVITGVAAGVLLGRIRLLSDVLSPYIKAWNSIPRVVLGAMFTIMFGLGLKSKIATAGILVFFVVFFNAFQGVREVDPNLIANARILGANRRRLTTEIIIPSALSWILASLHISFGLAIVGAVVGELFGATAGVGELIYSSKNLFDIDGVFAGMFLLAVIAIVAEALITVLENRLIRWRPSAVSGERQI
ncbi:MAG TPA: ABC transporter permease [Candidatus Acidoferrum sp.]|nr:ABC transporter permease [Candidatus Acidoferrum sp.]